MSILNLIQALDTGEMKKVTQLLDTNSYNPHLKMDVSMRDGDDRIALHYAAEVADGKTFQRIFDLDRSLIDCKDVNGYTPFLIATMSGNVEVMEILAESGANINHCDNDKHFAVHWAVVCGQVDALMLLLRLNANINAIDSQGAQPLHYATDGEDIAPETCETILHVLLKNGANVNGTDFDGRTPLLWATCNGNIKAMTALLQAGANLNVTDRNQLSLLHCATSQGHDDALKLLIEASEPAVIDSTDRNNDTPLFYAASLGHVECAKILLINGANPNYQDNRLKTPSHCAAAKHQLQILKILKHYGASFEIQNRRGDIPLHEAIQSGSKDIVEWLLLQEQETVNAVNYSGRSGLHLAAASGNMEIVVLLCTRNAKIDALMLSDDKLFTPLDIAELKKHDAVAEYLRTRHNANRACDLPKEKRLEWTAYLEEQINEAKKQNSRKTIIKVEYSQANNTSKLIQRRHSLEDVVHETRDEHNERPYTVPETKNRKKENSQCSINTDEYKHSCATSTTDLRQETNENDENHIEIIHESCSTNYEDNESNSNAVKKEAVKNEVPIQNDVAEESKHICEEQLCSKSLPANNIDLQNSNNRKRDAVDVLVRETEIEAEKLLTTLKLSAEPNVATTVEESIKIKPTDSTTSERLLDVDDNVSHYEGKAVNNHKNHKHKHRVTNERVYGSGKKLNENHCLGKKKTEKFVTSSKSRKSLDTTSSEYDSGNQAIVNKRDVVHTISIQSTENKFFYDYSSPEDSDNGRQYYEKIFQSKQPSRTPASQCQASIFDGIAEKNDNRKLTGSKKLHAQEEAIFRELTNLKKAQIQYGKQTEQSAVQTLIRKFCKRYSMEPAQITCNSYNEWEKLLNEQLKLLYAKEKQRLLRARSSTTSQNASRFGKRFKQSRATPINVHITELVDICNEPHTRKKEFSGSQAK